MNLRPIMLFACTLSMPTLLNAAVEQGWHSVSHNGQPVVTGSGRIVAQQRNVGNFNRVELKGSGNAQIRLGAAPSLTVQADDNLLPLLISRVENGTLVLESRGSYRTRTTPRYTITVPNLDYVATSGSGGDGAGRQP